MLEEKILSASPNSHIIVLPEMFTTGFTMNCKNLAESMDGPTVIWMQKIAKAKNAILAGSLIIREKEAYFNRLIWMLPTGEYGFYDKRHLFSYAGEDKHYTRGNKKLVGNVNGWKINLQVCYDLRFPVWSRQPVGQDMHYDMLINVANWPDKRSAAWKSLLTARAIENQCFVIGVNRVGTDGNGHHYDGCSGILDPLGNLLWTKENTEEIHTHTFHKADLEKVRSHFPFLNDADEYHIMI